MLCLGARWCFCATPRCTGLPWSQTLITSARSLYSKTPLLMGSVHSSESTVWTKPLAQNEQSQQRSWQSSAQELSLAVERGGNHFFQQQLMWTSEDANKITRSEAAAPCFFNLSREASVIYTQHSTCLLLLLHIDVEAGKKQTKKTMYCDKFHKNIPQQLLAGSIFLNDFKLLNKVLFDLQWWNFLIRL